MPSTGEPDSSSSLTDGLGGPGEGPTTGGPLATSSGSSGSTGGTGGAVETTGDGGPSCGDDVVDAGEACD
ncbi:MAG TPA: hypothetical protein VGB85_29920, partial [Nannocystis sp.]